MANKFRNFLESAFRIRIQPNHGKENDLSITRPGNGLVDMFEELEGSRIIDTSDLDHFRTLAEDRNMQYRAYDEMKEDSIISAALELYADDATQYNQDGKIIWAESEDPEISAFANRLLNILDLDKNAWTHIYSLCLYGDLYLETFRDEDLFSGDKVEDEIANTGSVEVKKLKNGYKMQEYVEAYPNPAEMFDITSHGKTVGFLKVPDLEPNGADNQYFSVNSIDSSETLYDQRKFVHISLNQDVTRFPEKVEISFQSDTDKDAKAEVTTKVFSVSRGKSILHDVYKIYQELKLLEDSMLLNRVTRSSIIRLLQLEVGDMPKSQVSLQLKRLKNLIEQKNMTDKNQGAFYSQAAPGPMDNVVYTTTRNGKGTISMNNIGGDVDVKSISDVDYFSNKLYGGLKIPKQFLGQDIDGGLGNGTSLTKIDSRYARTIKRIQNAYIQGIMTLINLYAIDKNLDNYVNNFTIKMTSPATVEDSERDEQMSSKMQLISDFIDLLGDSYSIDTKKEIFEYMVSTYIGDSTISEKLKDDKPEPEEPTESEGDFGESSGSSDFSSDVDVNIDSGFEEPEELETTGPEEFGSTEEQEEDFGDFENEF